MASIANAAPTAAERRQIGRGARDDRPVLALAGLFGLACGVSPFLHGLYAVSVWGIVALAALGVAWASELTGGVPRTRPATVALLALCALAAISLLSVSWAEARDNALTGAGRWTLYAASFAVLTAIVRSRAAARAGIAAGTAGIVIVGIWILGVMLVGDGPSLFLTGRLNDPLGYVNSEGLFLVLGIWPLLAWAERARPVLAGLAAAAATGLACLAFLSQARGVALAFLVAAVTVLALVPGRLTRAWLLVLIAGGVAAVNSPLLDVYQGANGPGFSTAVRHAGVAIVLAAAAVGVLWGIVGALRERIGGAGPRRLAAGALAVAALGVLAFAGVHAHRVTTYVGDQVRAFTKLQPTAVRSRLLSGGGTRYDYWRVAVHEFADHPIGGVGAGNYARDYYADRKTEEDVRQPHSIEFQTLAELGLPGVVALAAFLGAVGLGALQHMRNRAMGESDRVLMIGAAGIFAAWLTHSSVDWTHLFPGATGLALLAAAWLVWSPAAPVRGRRRGPLGPTGIFRIVLVSVVVAAGAVAVGRSLLGLHYLNDGKDALAADPARAIGKAKDSYALNGDCEDALYLQSAGYARLNDYESARTTLLRAARCEPHNFLPWALLGDLEVRRGHVVAARVAYTRAWRLNPRDAALRVLHVRPLATARAPAP